MSCEWPKGQWDSIAWVTGWDVPITDPAFLALEDLRNVRVYMVTVAGSVFYEGTVDISRPLVTRVGVPADIDGVSADGRAGTVVFTRGGGIVLTWKCNGGP